MNAPVATVTPAEHIAAFVAGLRHADIPAEPRRYAIRSLKDVIGISLASRALPYARMVTGMVTEWGRAPEATVFGSAARLPAVNAIIANGNMVHGIDFDDTHGEGMAHPGSCIIPTALAVAEKVGAGGMAVLEAIVAGLEVQTRIASAASTKFHARGFHPTFVSGCFGAAMAAGRLLGLTRGQLTHALGICGTQTSGSFEWLEDGSWAKRFGPGWAGRGGTIAALLAKRGYTGPKTIFEGRYGLYRSHVGEGNYSLERLVRGLGSEWETSKLIIKRYPCCHATHAFINAARTLKQTFGIRPEAIARVEARIQKQQAPIVTEPAASKRAPSTTYEAQFSIYYTVATALHRGDVEISDFTEDNLKDEVTLNLARLIDYVPYDPETFNRNHPGTLVVHMTDGARHEQSYDDDVDNPMTDDAVDQKFRLNASISLAPAQADGLLAALTSIEAAAAVAEILSPLACDLPVNAQGQGRVV